MGSSSSMKVHPFARGLWDQYHHHHQPHEASTTALALGCKRLRPLAPKLSTQTNIHENNNNNNNSASFDIKSFIKPESSPLKLVSSTDFEKKVSPQQVETHPGGTRWNPTQEQIGILEMLYKGGMRTPNAQQIEQITEQLAMYGKIEGKNVFYWFQNHKARERQKQKRSILGLSHSPRTPPSACSVDTSIILTLDAKLELVSEEESPYKRKCRSWSFDSSEDSTSNEEGHKTLELFPLHPERN